MSRPVQGQKRPLSRTRLPVTTSTQEIIEISDDDDDRSPKRQKSTPPIANGGINGFLHRQNHAGTSVGAPAQLKSATEGPIQKESTRSRDIKSPWQQMSKPTSAAVFKKPASRTDGLNNKERNLITKHSLPTEKSTSQPQKQTTKRLASAKVNGHRSDSRSSTTSTMSRKSSVKAPSPQRGAKIPIVNSQPEIIDSDEDDIVQSILDGDDASSDGESDVDDDMDILGHFLPNSKLKTSSSTAATIADTSKRPQTPASIVRDDIRPTPTLATIPIRQSPSYTRPPRPVTPPRQVGLQVVVSQSESKDDVMRKRAQLMVELKKDTRIAQEKRDVIERYFGQNGFSEAFSVDDLARMIQAAPLYKRPWKDPYSVKLDFGNPTLPFEREYPEYDEDGNFIRVNPTSPSEQVKIILNERFEPYQEHPRLTFRNDIDDRHINGRFQFIDEYLIREDVPRGKVKPNTGCSCRGVCNPSTCECLQKEAKNVSTGEVETKVIKTYKQHASNPDLIVLDEDYIANELNPASQHSEITECNETCGCGPSCWNRVVGRGRDVGLEIYMTERCGFGVRSEVDIKKGQFIDLYLGEVITEDELRAREAIRHPDAPSYIYSLDWFTSTNNLHVDGEEFGSAMRFVNHSCSPNARNFTVQTHHGDNKVYHLAFFAIRDIPAGEQITIDYSPQEALPDPVPQPHSTTEDHDMYDAPTDKGKGKAVEIDDNDEEAKPQELPGPVVIENDPNEEDESLIRCYCGAPNCRKYLWGKAKQQRRRKRFIKHT